MITAEKVNKLSTLTADQLNSALVNSGYNGFEKAKTCKFVGITTNGDFCYQFTYHCNNYNVAKIDKLFVNIDATGNIVAEY